MEDPNIVISFVSEEKAEDGYLILEQEDYPETDQLTMLDVVRLLADIVSDTSSTTTNTCIMSDDGKSFSATVLVYPYPNTLLYNVGVVNGSTYKMGGGVETKVETLKFSLNNVASIKYPIHSFTSGKWLSDVYDVNGSVVPLPLVTRDGQEIRVSEKVYGTYEVEYITWANKHIVNITARTEAVENFFQSVFYASFNYGIELLNLEPPPNAEENYFAGIDCNGNPFGDDDGGGDSTIVLDDDDPANIPKAEPVNETITLNYCEDFGNE